MNVNRETGEMVADPSMGALVSAEQQRAIAEVQAQMILARMNPRDPARAEMLILKDCERLSYAETGLYLYARGGTDISGVSIHSAQGMAQRWGNINWGIRELEQRQGESVVQSYAQDLETNAKTDRVFTVQHVRETRDGLKDLTSPRDIYELTANQGSRRTRACLLAVLPDDIVEKARQKMEETLLKYCQPTPDLIEKLIERFAAYGVTKTQIEDYIQRKVEAMKPYHVAKLFKIGTSIKDGMSSPGDWFKGASKSVKMPSAKPAPETTQAADAKPETPPSPAALPPAASPATPSAPSSGSASAPRSPAPAPTAPAPAPEEAQVTSVTEERDHKGTSYFLIVTADGARRFTTDPKLAGEAAEAKTSGRRVRFEGQAVKFTAAPFKVTKVIAAEEREPGEDG